MPTAYIPHPRRDYERLVRLAVHSIKRLNPSWSREQCLEVVLRIKPQSMARFVRKVGAAVGRRVYWGV